MKRLYSMPLGILVTAFVVALLGALTAGTAATRLGATGLVLMTFSALAATPALLHPWDESDRADQLAARRARLLEAALRRRANRSRALNTRISDMAVHFDPWARPLAGCTFALAVGLALFGGTRSSVAKSLTVCGLMVVGLGLLIGSYTLETIALFARNRLDYGPKAGSVTFFGVVEFAVWLRTSMLARWLSCVCFFVGVIAAYFGLLV